MKSTIETFHCVLMNSPKQQVVQNVWEEKDFFLSKDHLLVWEEKYFLSKVHLITLKKSIAIGLSMKNQNIHMIE